LGHRTLVVDDNATNRRYLEATLSSWGMKVECVESGPAALAAVQRAQAKDRPIGTILLDMHMPGMDGFDVAARLRALLGDHVPRIMLLTSAGRVGDGSRCRELGMEAYLTKPIRQRDLRHALLELLAERREGGNHPETSTPSTPRDSGPALRVLLAEDNAINRKVAVALLEKLGHEAQVACTGTEALAAWERESFDLILMDVQMPEMDGFDATRAIRAQEKSDKASGHTPIVALTAHAMKGDEERCLEAGMDAYLSKPIRLDALRATLDAIRTQGCARAAGGIYS